MKRVVVVTYVNHINYGAAFQAYATGRLLDDIGVQAQFLNIHKETPLFLNPFATRHVREMVRRSLLDTTHLVHRGQLKRKEARFRAFIRENVPLTEEYADEAAVMRRPPEADVYLTGSDQMFNTASGIRPVFMLAFAPEGKPRVSFATSMGNYRPKGERLEAFLDGLRTYEALSLREVGSADFLSDALGRETDCHMDPSLTLGAEEWNRLVKDPSPLYPKPYILVYQLMNHPLLRETVETVRKATGLDVVCVTGDCHCSVRADRVVRDAGPVEFLHYMRDAAFVVTTSFHGTCFSVIYRKPFYALIQPGEKRITGLLQHLSLNDRLVRTISPEFSSDLSWEATEAYLSEERESARRYLLTHVGESDTSSSPVRDGQARRKKERIVLSRVDEKTPDTCTGCRACEALCPVQAIRMREDEKGFFFPEVDDGLCIRCGLCAKLCPQETDLKHTAYPEAYAVRNRDAGVRQTSTSGGAFTALSDAILQDGGIVWGAVYDERMQVVHRAAETAEERDRMCGSKYVKSRMTADDYRTIREQLKTGRTVMYTGTPCQTAGLRAFLKRPFDNLLTVDIICHGTPSPKVFSDFLSDTEKQYGSSVGQVQFRYKNPYWRGSELRITRTDGHVYPAYNSLQYMTIFQGLLAHPSSCFGCHYCDYHRVSDLTLADFWGIEKTMPDFDDNRGVSCVLVSTEKGQAWLNRCRETCDIRKSRPEDCIQKHLKEPPSEPYAYGDFWKLYREKGIRFVLRRFCPTKRAVFYVRRTIRKIRR